jgi:hypothetical protein
VCVCVCSLYVRLADAGGGVAGVSHCMYGTDVEHGSVKDRREVSA